MTDSFFFDTYAIVEIVKGNKNYIQYEHSNAITSIFNIKELYYALLRDFDKSTADLYADKYAMLIADVHLWIIKKAMEFKLLHKRDSLSYTDCIGYVFALENHIKFLTGDKKFEGLPNVEFVK